MTEPSPFAILKLRDCSQAKSKHSNRELWQGQCAESSAITDRGKRVPISLRIVANALKKKRNSSIQFKYFFVVKVTASCNRFFACSLSMHLFAKSTISNYYLK